MTKNIKLLALVATVLILNAFFFVEIGSVGWLIIHLTFLLATFLVAAPKLDKTSELLQPGLVVGLTTWMAILLSQRSQPEVALLLAVGVLGGLLLLHDAVTNSMTALVSSLSEVVFLPLRSVGNYFASIVSLHFKKKDDQKENAEPSKLHTITHSLVRNLPLKSLVIGLVISIPVLFMLVTLLRGADPIFAKNFEAVFKLDGVEKLVQRISWSLVLLAALSPWFFAVAKKKFASPLASVSKMHFVTEWTVVMGMVAAVLLTFAWIQWQYIFVPPVRGVELSQFGIATYSEYVQKGFNEFVFLSLFIQGLLWVGLSALRSHTVKGKRGLFAVQLIVWAEAVFILLAFFRRIWLYQSFHGLTLVRIYGGFVVAWVGVMALGLLGRHFINTKWVRFELLGTALLLIALGTMNPVRYVAEVKPPTVNERVDYTYLSRLSSDGAAGWVSAYTWVKDTLNSDAYKQPVIDAAARKDLVYSPTILKKTLSNRVRLINEYGTAEEKKEAAELMFSFAQREVDEAIANLDRAMQMRNAVTPEGVVITPQELAIKSYVADPEQYDKLGRYQSSLVRVKNELASRSAMVAKLTPAELENARLPLYVAGMEARPSAYTSRVTGVTQTVVYSDMLCQNLQFCVRGSYLNSEIPNSWLSAASYPIYPDGKTDQKSGWEAYIGDTPADSAAHALLKQEVPLGELLELQRTYFRYLGQASRQNLPDRTVDLDLDLDAPFLGTMNY